MRHKELRIALVCYGGVSLAVYMHGVTKELWKLARASRDYHGGQPSGTGSEAVYRRLLEAIEQRHALRLRVLPDIVAGASAGGINGVFLAQAIHSGQSLEPLTELWLGRADVDVLLDPDARLWSRFLKFWAVPVVRLLLKQPGNVVSASVAPETRSEVRSKLSRLIRSRWFQPPFGGIGFSRLLAEALDAMGRTSAGPPLLPPGHPLDLFVTATDFAGYAQMVRLHSPAEVSEQEHRLPIGFRAAAPAFGGKELAPVVELVLAARATASFPGAFPALRLAEIDRLVAERGEHWAGREAFVARVMPAHRRASDAEEVSLIDGSVLVNAPFAEAMSVLRDRPASREVDRRLVYIDPKPQDVGGMQRGDPRPPGFFSVIFGSLSSIPREQPIRDNLEALAGQSRDMGRMVAMVDALRGEVEEAVQRLFGHTPFFNRPTQRRLARWRAKAQQAAAERAGFAWVGYGQLKFGGVLDALARLVADAAPDSGGAEAVYERLLGHLRAAGLERLNARKGASDAAVEFFRDHDLAFRIRRLRLLARRLSDDWQAEDEVAPEARQAARDAVYAALSLYFDREGPRIMGEDFPAHAARVHDDPGAVLALIAARRQLREADRLADALLAAAMAEMPAALKRRVLLTYLGFPFYDTVTLPLLRSEGLTEIDPVKVDRISPEDCNSIRPGGAAACLRGTEFYHFGAFFSRAYRENDYLWGRLHGAERMIDLIASTVPGTPMGADELSTFKRAAFLAVLEEEEARLIAEPTLVPVIRGEVLGRV